MRPSLSRLTATVVALAVAVPLAGPASASHAIHATRHRASGPTWTHVDVPGSDSEFRGLDALDANHAWIAGYDGEIWKTADGGATWVDVAPRGAGKLEFRDIEATDAEHALALSAGPGRASRIYRTTDGGTTWSTTFVNQEKSAFYDCMDMYPGGRNGFAVSDPVDGRFRLQATYDSGRTWHRLRPVRMPRAEDGEYGLAASGTCLVTAGQHDVYFSTGGTASRVFHSADNGRHWQIAATSIPGSEASATGAYGLDFRGPQVGLVVGGDYLDPKDGVAAAARTFSGGDTWSHAGDLGGYRSGVAWRRGRTAIAVGITGSDLTRDAGVTWHTFSHLYLDAVDCAYGACWATGKDGTVVRFDV